MNRFDLDWLSQWSGLADGRLAPLLGTVVALLALMLMWNLARRPRDPRAVAQAYDASSDRFSQTAPINEEQVQLLRYLQQAFPDGAVLFRPRLARFLTVRKSSHRLGAQQRLADAQVDFLVCADDGKPLFAFEVDAFRDQDDADIARGAAEKNRMLKSADIRLIRLKGALPNWPPAEILRMRLLAAQRTPAADGRPSGVSPSGFGPSSFAHTDFAHSRSADSDVMGLSRLMGMPATDDPWESVRKR